MAKYPYYLSKIDKPNFTIDKTYYKVLGPKSYLAVGEDYNGDHRIEKIFVKKTDLEFENKRAYIKINEDTFNYGLIQTINKLGISKLFPIIKEIKIKEPYDKDVLIKELKKMQRRQETINNSFKDLFKKMK